MVKGDKNPQKYFKDCYAQDVQSERIEKDKKKCFFPVYRVISCKTNHIFAVDSNIKHSVMIQRTF